MRRGVIVGWMACLIGCLVAASPRPARAQAISAHLYGRILNPKGQGVAGARVRVVRLSTGLAREVSTNAHGDYSFLSLPPGRYQFTVLARGYATLLNSRLELRMGQHANYSPTLTPSPQPKAQNVSTQPLPIETTRSANVLTIDSVQINELPINRRNFLDFVLLDSQVKPDNTPLSAVYPTSGLDVNGQRGRENEVTVDGADIVGKSTGSVQQIAPLEDVRTFQVMPNNYQPENGRAASGVVNVLTKSGTDNFHGSVYGFLRNSRIQARNPFSVQVDPTTGVASGVKQSYTRVQTGFTLGGSLQQNKFFYFLSGEALLRHTNGFSAIGENNFGLTSETIPCLTSPVLVTSAQASYFKNAIAAAGGCSSPGATPLIKAAQLYGAASDAALNGQSQASAILNDVTGVPTTFPLPVNCNYLVTGSCGPSNVVPLPQSYIGLNSLIGNYPTTERDYIGTVRLDRIWNENQRSFLFVSFTPSYQTGIQVNTPNQNLGFNAGSRGAAGNFLNQTVTGQHLIQFSNTLVNAIRFQWSRQGVGLSYSPLTTGSSTSTVTTPGNNPAVNIPGVAFLGGEPYAPIHRLEKRYEGSDLLTWVHGRHWFKFGVDGNLLQISSTPGNLFNLNYGGVYDFAPASANFLLAGLPDFTSVQAYGLGLPQGFTQGIGTSYQPFNDKLFGAFAQDTWRVTHRLTLNYGVRYDVALTPLLTPETTFNQAAQQAMNVVQGLPRDYKDVSPRLGVAFDPTGHGTTVVRAGFGIFYDMAPLALIYDSTAADGALSTQLQLPGGLPSGAAVTQDNLTQVLNAASVFQGVLGGVPTVTSAGTTVCGGNLPAYFGFDCTSQRFNPTLINSVFANQSYLAAGYPLTQLPFTLPVASNFVNAYSEQGSLSVEHLFEHNYKVTVAYTWIHGLHLNRARNINQPDSAMMADNFANAIKAGLLPSNPLTVLVPLGTPGSCISTSGTSSVRVISSGTLGAGYGSPNCTGASFGYIGTPSVFNDFRPSGPNPSYAGALAVNYDQLVALAKEAGYPTGFGVPVPWGNVNQQESSGSSLYNGLTVSVSKHFSNNFQFLSSWTWSHALDNSTDLTTELEPQNNSYPNLAWGNSTFDQRQRWVTSAIINSPYHSKTKGFLQKLLANSYVAPIVVYASGRPYSVLSGADYNLNFNANTDRPSVVKAGTGGSVRSPYISNVAFVAPTDCAGIPASVQSPFGQTVAVQPYGCTGNLGRNTFVTPSYFDIDLRLDKKFYLTDTLNFEFIAEGFNLLNRFNVKSVNLVCNPTAGSTCTAGEPSAVFNPREFQFGLKFNF